MSTEERLDKAEDRLDKAEHALDGLRGALDKLERAHATSEHLRTAGEQARRHVRTLAAGAGTLTAAMLAHRVSRKADPTEHDGR